MTANLNVFETSKKDFSLSKSVFFSQKFIGWYIESDKEIKNFDDMGDLRDQIVPYGYVLIEKNSTSYKRESMVQQNS